MNKDSRRNFALRLQPSDGTLLAEVIDWLQSISLAERRNKVEEAFVVMMLPYARKARLGRESEEVESCYWSTHSRILQHLYVMQQTLDIKIIQPIDPVTSIPTEKEVRSVNDEFELEEEDEEFDNFRSTNSLLGIGQ